MLEYVRPANNFGTTLSGTYQDSRLRLKDGKRVYVWVGIRLTEEYLLDSRDPKQDTLLLEEEGV
jgi:hypothetical protein